MLPLSHAPTKLREHLLHLVEQAAGGGSVLDGQRVSELAQQLSLNACELFWCLDGHLHDEISATALVEMGHALRAKTKFLPALCAFRNLQHGRTFERGYLHLGAERRLRERDGQDAMQVIAIALEELVRLDREHDVQIAGGSAEATGIALALIADARSLFDSCRNADVDHVLALDATISAAHAAGIRDHRACASACVAGPGNGEKALLISDLSMTLALLAGRWTAPIG